jgi:predicted LPLAT superfamily acyltransferase
LLAGCVVFAVVYAPLVWYFDLLSTGERRAIADYVSKVLIYRKREAT